MTKPDTPDREHHAIFLVALQLVTLVVANDWRPGGDRGAILAAVAYPLAATLLLAWNLAATAAARGHARAWGLFAFLSLIGVTVVHWLPNRPPRRGFPIEPNQP